MSVSRLEQHDAVATKRGRLGAVAALTAALSGCANQTTQHYAHGHEYFSQAQYGHASPKVIADGEPVPKGGGQYLVGHPYTIAGHTYYPSETTTYTSIGMASWYGAAFHGRRTANGEVYDMASLTAAHPTMPLPSYARVTNLSNGYSVIVRVNDRGPYHGGRVMDVSSRAADMLGFKGAGTAKIKVEYVGRAPLEGSDDATLMASLRTDGSPATLAGYSSPVLVASRSEPSPSGFAALFGRAGATPQPAPIMPQPEPIRIADAEPTPEPEPAKVTRVAIALHQPRAAVPLPPPRPFDLGSMQVSILLAAATPPQRSAGSTPFAMPPRRPILQASAEKALYFSDSALPRLRGSGPFDRARPAKGLATDE
jgi:rare lipoprotein A